MVILALMKGRKKVEVQLFILDHKTTTIAATSFFTKGLLLFFSLFVHYSACANDSLLYENYKQLSKGKLYEESILGYKSLIETTRNTSIKIKSLIALGIDYTENGEYHKSVPCFERAIDFAFENSDSLLISIAYFNYASCSHTHADSLWAKSLTLYKKALVYNPDLQDIVNTNINASYDQSPESLLSNIEVLKKSLEQGVYESDSMWVEFYLENIVYYYERLNIADSALKYVKQLHQIELDKENVKHLVEVTESKNKILASKAELKSQKRITLLVAVASIVIIVLIIILIAFYVLKARMKKRVVEANRLISYLDEEHIAIGNWLYEVLHNELLALRVDRNFTTLDLLQEKVKRKAFTMNNNWIRQEGIVSAIENYNVSNNLIDLELRCNNQLELDNIIQIEAFELYQLVMSTYQADISVCSLVYTDDKVLILSFDHPIKKFDYLIKSRLIARNIKHTVDTHTNFFIQ